MLTYLRYALATFCFAASVGCLALWWHWDKLLVVDYFGIKHQIGAAAEYGISSFYVFEEGIPRQTTKWRVAAIKGWELPWFYNAITREGLFGRDDNGVYFPLRYAALVSALAGVAALRLGRRFTLRSAIIVTTGNQRIYAIGTGNNQYANIYSIDPFTAVATKLPPSVASPDIVRGVNYGFHSSPISLWSVTDDSGVLSGHSRTLNSGAAQASLAYAAGDVSAGFVPHLVHVEDRSFINDLAIDTARNTLVRITGFSNPRLVQTIGPLNADFDDEGGLT
jgi:hypothetical protein